MSEKPPFDVARACFYLIAAMLGFQCLTVAFTLGWCAFAASPEIISGQFECNRGGRLSELLGGALATVLAFSGGFSRGDRK